MKHLVVITIMTFIAGIFVASQGLAGQYGSGTGAESGAVKGTSQQTGQQPGMKADCPPGVTAHQLDSTQVREMQKILHNKGYSSVPIDGQIGPETQQALRSFQENQGLAVTGTPDQETLRALAPDAQTQELFGISPEFGQEGVQQPMQQEPMQQEPMQQEPMQQEPIQQPQEQWESPSATEPSGSY